MSHQQIYVRPKSATVGNFLICIACGATGALLILGGGIPTLFAGKIMEGLIVIAFGVLAALGGACALVWGMQSDRAIASAPVKELEVMAKRGTWHAAPRTGRGKVPKDYVFAIEGEKLFESMSVSEAGCTGPFKKFETATKDEGTVPIKVWYVEDGAKKIPLRIEADLG